VLGVARLICKLRDHSWEPCPLEYDYNSGIAYIGEDPKPVALIVAWVCDEVCSRCGVKSWWPT